jgi:hypothetical protein
LADAIGCWIQFGAEKPIVLFCENRQPCWCYIEAAMCRKLAADTIEGWCDLSRSIRISEYMAELQAYNWAAVVPWGREASSFMQCDVAEGAETREVFEAERLSRRLFFGLAKVR